MPPYKDVVTAFFSKYSFSNQESFLRFQRKKEGWFVSQDHYNTPGNYFNTVLFWSKEKNSFIDIDYPRSDVDSGTLSEAVNNYLNQIHWEQEEYQFQRNKYYGYP